MAEPPHRDPRRLEPPLERVRSRPPAPDDPDGARGPSPPPLPATIRLASRGREPVVLTVVIAIFLAAALWKPWAAPAGPPPLVQAPPTPRASEPASPAADPLRGLRAECEEPAGWRVYSHEAFIDQVVRVWRSVQPADAASGPLDPTVPVVPAGPANRGLGYCAPWAGPDTPPAASTVSVWRITRNSGAADAALPVRLRAVAPNPPDVRGVLYEGPGAAAALDEPGSAWPAGRYVFAVRSAAWERWWAVQILPERAARP